MTEETNNRRGNTVLLTVIAVATLLVAVIGATFAYFSVTITGNDTATSVIVKTAQLAVVYTSGDAINAANIVPGWKLDGTAADRQPKEFTVRNDSDVDVVYNVFWDDVTNSFVGDELFYTVTGLSSSGTNTPGSLGYTPAPTADDEVIVSNKTLAPGETHTYTLYMEFPNVATSDQNSNQGVGFFGKIQVSTEEVTD